MSFNRRDIDIRLGLGEIAVGSFDTSYSISSFPIQADQPKNLQWLAPSYFDSSYPSRRVQSTSLSQDIIERGSLSWQWQFGLWSQDMMSYFLTTFFNNLSNPLEKLPSNRVTVQTYDESEVARIYYAEMLRPRDFTIETGVFIDVRIDFVFGAIQA